NERLRESVLAVSEAMLSVLKSVEKQQPAEAAEPPVATLATVALARRTTNSAPPGTEGHVIFVLAPGAAYGLDAADGKILWRRPVGFSTNGRTPGFPPTPIAEKAGSDAIMVDAARNEVLRIESATGSPRWRHSLGERFDAHPVVADKELLVATRSGRLARINLDEGGSAAYVQFPQELRVGPTVDFRRSNIYQVAEHSNLFVVSLGDGKPKQVVYLGHLPGSITVSPVLINRYLIVAENDGVEHSTLRVLALDAEEEGEPPVRVLQSVRLEGHVDSPPQVSGVRMLVATDQGELYVFEISGTDAEKPLVPVAQSTASSEEKLADEASPQGLIRFPLLKGSRVWIADSQLTWYDVQPSQGRLQPRGIKNERSATTQPLLAIGETVFHVRRDVGLPGIQVSAIAPEQGDPLWEIHLAAPLVSEPMIDAASGQITAVNAIGAIFHVDSAGLEGDAAIDQPVVALKPAEIRGPVTDVIRVKDRLLVMAFGSGTKQLPVFDPAEGARFRWLSLPHPLGGHPLAFGDGLLAPTEVGQAFLLNVRSGKRQIEPFQPPLTSGEQVVWSRPALAGPEAMLLAESHTGLYRIGVKEKPKPHLASLAEADLAEPIVSPLAVLENVVYALDAADSLLAFELPGLTPSPPRPLGAKSVWGPGRVGDHVLLATDDDQLYCLDSAQKIVWQVALPYGRLAGAPLLVDGQYVLAAANGVIWRVESATGKEVGSVETGYPLATGPVRLGDGLLVGGHDGSLYKVKMP
ncbi:MAG: PQQ-binding-like beta-propeller repeat protein, partial [Planctomycetes bacterium]|nr:PQQ-binding-like beta-propeller repeat protein [Planctomycetota bacterium]